MKNDFVAYLLLDSVAFRMKELINCAQSSKSPQKCMKRASFSANVFEEVRKVKIEKFWRKNSLKLKTFNENFVKKIENFP